MELGVIVVAAFLAAIAVTIRIQLSRALRRVTELEEALRRLAAAHEEAVARARTAERKLRRIERAMR